MPYRPIICLFFIANLVLNYLKMGAFVPFTVYQGCVGGGGDTKKGPYIKESNDFCKSDDSFTVVWC